MKQPWLKFYPNDWRGDLALGPCSIAARGLWMEMLCIMADAEPRGSLVKDGRQLSIKQLAAIARCPIDQVEALLAELEEEGVFSRDEDGTIFSRRMRRDQDKAEQDKANGKKGGSPLLKKGVNPPVNQTDAVQDKGEDKAQKPEARDQIDSPSLRSEESTRVKRERKFEFPPGAFDRWYAEYPHKVGRGAAEKAFSAVHKADKVSFDHLMAGLARYKRTKPVERAWCNPSTWLHQERWMDGQAGPLLVSTGCLPADEEPKVDFGGGVRWPISTVRSQIERFRESPRSWPEILGPPPGQPGCRVPPELLADRAAA